MDGGEVVAAEEYDMGTCSGDSGGGDKVDVDEFDFEPSGEGGIGGIDVEFFHFFRDLIENYRFDSGFFVKIGGGDKSVTNFCSVLCVFGGV